MKVLCTRLLMILAAASLAVGCGSQSEERSDSNASSGGGSAKAKKLGDISDEDTGLDFEGHSVYAVINEGTLNFLYLNITSYAVDDSQFKEVDDWECEEAPEVDEDVDVDDFNSITLTFMASATEDEDHKVNEDGFPTEDEYEVEEDEVDPLEGLTISSTFDSDPGFGTVEFDSLPEEAGDELEATLTLTIDGEDYEATVTAEVFEMPDNPTPDCDSDEIAVPVYD